MSLLWKSAREEADAARYAIQKFLERASREIPAGSTVLDAGAGNCRYQPLFPGRHYIGTDFCRVPGKQYAGASLVTDLCKISLRDNSVDAIINIQVLEHVPDPQLMLCEFQRVLRPGGKLYLTCPQGWGVHDKPYDYFRFTNYALTMLFERAGFDVISITPKGGYFKLLGKLISRLPWQIPQPPRHGWRRPFAKLGHALIREVFHYWVPYLCNYLDRFDRQQDFTIGYMCITQKRAVEN